jgi:hypothetical protein
VGVKVVAKPPYMAARKCDFKIGEGIVNMTFQVTKILDSKTDDVLVQALHQDNPIPVTIRVSKDHSVSLEKPLQAEISFDEIISWKIVDDFEDAQSGIWQEQDGIHLLGRVHSVLYYGEEDIVTDVYLQNGQEFFTVNLNAAKDEVPGANEGLEIVVKILFLFPGPQKNQGMTYDS